MYDVFIDEEKVKGHIGFLVTRNTPALQQILFTVRQSNQNYRKEIKFRNVSNNAIHVVLSWLNVFFTNDCHVMFVYRKWDGSLTNKKNIIINTLNQIKLELKIKTNLVAFMDFDTNHKNLNLQNQVRASSKIMRCYHLDSKCFDMLQLSDVLLQCAIKMEAISYDKNLYLKLIKEMNHGRSIPKTKLKYLIVLHALKQHLRNKKIRKKLVQI